MIQKGRQKRQAEQNITLEFVRKFLELRKDQDFHVFKSEKNIYAQIIDDVTVLL